MFLSRITRAVFGNAASSSAHAAPRTATLGDVLAIGNPVLRAHFGDRYRNPITNRDAAAREQSAVCAQTLDVAPLTVAIELITRSPLMEAFNHHDRSEASRRLANAFEAVTEAAFRAMTARHVDNWPIATFDLPKVLDALATSPRGRNAARRW